MEKILQRYLHLGKVELETELLKAFWHLALAGQDDLGLFAKPELKEKCGEWKPVRTPENLSEGAIKLSVGCGSWRGQIKWTGCFRVVNQIAYGSHFVG